MKKNVFLGLLFIISIMFIVNLKIKNHYVENNNIIGIYVDNELQESIPKKGDAVFSKAICDNDNVNYYWDVDNWGLFVDNLNKKTKCNLYFINYSGQTVFNFDYTGAEQTFTAPVSGTYRLETWGAQGSSNLLVNPVATGGYGGYSNGLINLNKDDILYIAVGERGKDGEKAYNGGGYGQIGGGGTTHIALKSGTLNNLKNDIDKILIVSGGGGGNDTSWKIIPSGGGFKGVNGEDTISGGQNLNPNTSYNGSFGQGGNSIILSNNDSGGGGGGGFYGGSGSMVEYKSGGGGSGYIGNPILTNKVMYCHNCEESNEESTKTISTTCNEETSTTNCAKKGNGYARITLVSIDE